MASRKYLQLVSVVALVALLAAGCGGASSASNLTPTAPAEAPTTAPVEAPTTAAVEAPTTAPTIAPTEAPTTAPTEAPAATSAPTAAPVATTSATTATTSTMTSTLQTPEEAALAAAGGQKIGGSVSFAGPWGGDEQTAFMNMVKPFEDATGIQVEYTGSRDLLTLLVTRVQAGNPPDIADFANPGQMVQFAQQGKLVDLGKILDMTAFNQQYAKTWADIGTVNGQLVGVVIKLATKGLVWYNPVEWQAKGYQIPKTWDDLMALSNQIAATGTTPWCVAVESGAASGWPGTDWLEDIVLRQSGIDAYNQWWQGKLAWTSPEIKQAWQTWGQIVANPKMVFGGTNRMLTANFANVADPLFTDPPGCDMAHQASFMGGFIQTDFPKLKPVTGYTFFPFPPFEATGPSTTETGGDVDAVFNDTPQSRALIRYLASAEAQDIWAKIGGGYLSANKAVPLSDYPDELSRKAADILVSAQVAAFDASDQMPAAMTNAFYKAVLDYIQNPGSLDSILANLDSVQKTAYGK